MSRFLEALRSGRVLLMDGAMGTELQRAGIGNGECYEYWNLEHPEKVRAIHASYVATGAEVLVTNTFQANPQCLERFGLAHDLEAISEAGISLAREVGGPERFVLASMGPLPEDLSINEIQRTVAALSSADGLLLETTSTLRDLVVIHAHAPTELPLLLSLAFCRNEDGSVGLHGPFRLTMEGINRAIEMVQLAALGVNCGRDVGLDEILEIVRFYCRATEIPIFVRPNAGIPTRVGDHWDYPLTPQALAERLPKFLEAGVRMIGGCCGTTPEHIAAVRPIINAYNLNGGCAT
jgi:methionine synthase I (cobalamin-dependent)